MASLSLAGHIDRVGPDRLQDNTHNYSTGSGALTTDRPLALGALPGGEQGVGLFQSYAN